MNPCLHTAWPSDPLLLEGLGKKERSRTSNVQRRAVRLAEAHEPNSFHEPMGFRWRC